MSVSHRTRGAASALMIGGVLFALAACGTSGSTTEASSAAPATSATSEAATSSGTAATDSTASESAATSGTTAAGATVNANTASKEEIQKALEDAGVANAAQLANEVEEYRPYTAENLKPKLTEELAKYNVDSATIDTIVSVLTV